MKTFLLKKSIAPLVLAALVMLLVVVLSLTMPNPDAWLAWLVCGLIATFLVYGYFASTVRLNSSHLYIRAEN